MGLEFRILGPLEVIGEEGPLPLGGRRERVVLALLLLNANRRVSSDELSAALWGESPPPTAANAIHVVISRLRRLVARHAELRTERGGYRLQIDPRQLDLERFERLLEEGRAALADARAEAASAQLRDALALWRGPALADLGYEPFAQSEIARLEELRFAAIEERIEADLALGGQTALVAELTTLVREHPLRERLRAQLMVALYRSGRQADALAAYQEARKTLVDELGVEPGAELRELNQRILNQDAALAAPEARPRGIPPIPVPATSFVGRERELADLSDLLVNSGVRLVTLRGPGGSGKSRLALEAARVLGSAFADGVVFVPLASLHDPAYVLQQVAQYAGVQEIPGELLAETLARALRGRELLLVVDNLDHLLAAGAELSQLLMRTRALKLLVTSRVALRVAPEHVLEVGPLPLPESVALFGERARAVAPSFQLTDEHAEPVTEICRRLDGLPLAVELAAARTNVLSPEEILARMDRRLGLLTGGPRDVPARQRTLRATIDWSHELLAEREQILFRRVAVFAAGATLEAAATICGLPEDDLVDGLAALVESSMLLRREAEPAEPRFSMLETIREYALERLGDSGEEEEIRSRHASHFLEFAETAYAQRLGHERRWSSRLEAEHDNLRGALDYLRGADPAGHLRLAGALAWFWDAHSHLREGRERLEAALEVGGRADAEHARALRGAGTLAVSQADVEAAFDHFARALALWQDLGEELERAWTLQFLAHAHFIAGEMETSAECAAESVALLEELGRPDAANWPRVLLAHALVAQHDVERAEGLADRSLAAARAADDARLLHGAQHVLGDCALVRGDCELARERYRASLRLVWELGDRLYACYELDHLAAAFAACGEPRSGLRLAASAAAQLDDLRTGVDNVAFWTSLRERHLGRARRELGTEADAVWEEGQRLSLERAVEEALAR